jgi:DNA-binding winged helix-turn-helix (wHTH) protein/TolB-like protein/Tfp pilus assembly protein PilF
MNPAPLRGYRFDDYTLDLGRRRLSAPGQESVALSGRAFDVLAYLLANRDRMVSKKELLEAVWPRMVVEENTLTQAISGLRRALGDSRESPRYVATIAGRGYQFVGEVSPLAEARQEASPQPDLPASLMGSLPRVEPSPAPEDMQSVPPAALPVDRTPTVTHSRRSLLLWAAGAASVAAGIGWLSLGRQPRQPGLPASIAVLPFKPLVPSARNEAIETGIAELLINRLSALPGVVVSPLSSVRRFSSVEQDPLLAGRELAVAAVLDGTVQIEGERMRLTARLLDVASGESLWAGSYTESSADFFAVQEALVAQLVGALAVDVSPELRARLARRETTTDAEAWQLYANGRYQLERRDPEAMGKARNFFQAAIDRDPRFTLAITGLSEAWALSGTFAAVPPLQAFEEARKAAQRALDIDPELPPALTALGHVLTQLDRDWSGGRRLYERSLALDPGAALTHAYLSLNLTQSAGMTRALEHIDRAQRLEPQAMPFMALGGWVRYHARRFEESARMLDRLVETTPQAVLPRQFLARVRLAQGDAGAALALLEGRNSPAPGSYSTLGRAYAAVGNVTAARAEVARVEAEGRRGFGVGYDLALLHLALGERDTALDWLERAVGDGSQMLGYLRVDPAMDALRDEPRTQAVAARIGLA